MSQIVYSDHYGVDMHPAAAAAAAAAAVRTSPAPPPPSMREQAQHAHQGRYPAPPAPAFYPGYGFPHMQMMPYNHTAPPPPPPAPATVAGPMQPAGARYAFYPPPPHTESHTALPSHSPESSSSRSPQTPPPPATTTAAGVSAPPHVLASQQQLVTPLVSSSPPSFTNPTTDRVKETIARANSVPMEFYHTEFLEYSKETYEKKKMDARRGLKRKRQQSADITSAPSEKKAHLEAEKNEHETKQHEAIGEKNNNIIMKSEDDDPEDDDEDQEPRSGTAELRRQIHIQSEQKRRAQIKDGFDELRNHLPGCNNKKMSKASLLIRTVQHMQHLKKTQNELLEEVERLVQENENLKR
ncbi:hypothetical protein BCR43DRAFT_525082 [Syncephalastrum racemosum]|uniref:BHLH domain-containing protein n=1 Tax=Syncephalastrum racemosum TaxID=13706 RepID=A0A1X2H9J5_SYNRA|nr:hypothetical protein BCR43DRAFT_525082 [Syncephalastrum racemosum]